MDGWMDECFALVFTRPAGTEKRGERREEGEGGGVEEGVDAVVTLQAPA